jgi:MoaA/NifB/PqqE/SkfB family radical SAM enzyme
MIKGLPQLSACWRVTRRCNLDCAYCLAGDGHLSYAELGSADRMWLARALASSGVGTVSLTGGEPTMLPDLPEVLKVLHSAHINVRLVTNGTSDSALLEGLLPFVDEMRFSMEAGELNQELLRNGAPISSVLRQLRMCDSSGVGTSVAIVASSPNCPAIPSTITQLASLGVTRFVLMEYMNRERGARAAILMPTAEQLDVLEVELLRLKHLNPQVSVRFNRYSAENDRYLIVETDGSLVYCSERGSDCVVGNALTNPELLRGAILGQHVTHEASIELDHINAEPVVVD